jgi:hypothetical protein
LFSSLSSVRNSPSRGGEAEHLLFASDGERAFCRRQKSFLDVFLGAGNKVATATQVELVLNIFAWLSIVFTLR